jgi:hypothetical protein
MPGSPRLPRSPRAEALGSSSSGSSSGGGGAGSARRRPTSTSLAGVLLEAAAGSPVRGAVTGASAGAPAGAALAGSDPRLHASADHGAALAGSAASDLTKFQDASFLHSVLGSLPGVGAMGGVGDVSDLDEALAQVPSPPMAAPAPTMAPSRNLFSFHRSGSSGVEAAGEHAVSLAPRSFFERAPTGSMGMAPTMAPTGSMGMPIHPSAASGAVSGAGSGSSAASGAGPSAGAHHDAPGALPLPAAPPKLSSSWTLPKPQLKLRTTVATHFSGPCVVPQTPTAWRGSKTAELGTLFWQGVQQTLDKDEQWAAVRRMVLGAC